MNKTKSLVFLWVFFLLLGLQGQSADMKKTKQLRRPSPKQYNLHFNTKHTVPPKHKIYTSDKPSPVRAVAEFEEMGGVLIAYPGTETPKAYQTHPQLPPTKNRAFGIPDELIIKMQQLETGKPVHIFIMCNMTEEENNALLDRLGHLAKSLCLPFDRSLFHFIPWDTDTYWTRDFGPWWIQNKKTGIYSIAKHIYTTQGGGNVGQVEEKNQEIDTKAWNNELGIFRPYDDYGAVKVSDYLNFPINK
jgi:agmatine deiminase